MRFDTEPVHEYSINSLLHLQFIYHCDDVNVKNLST